MTPAALLSGTSPAASPSSSGPASRAGQSGTGKRFDNLLQDKPGTAARPSSSKEPKDSNRASDGKSTRASADVGRRTERPVDPDPADPSAPAPGDAAAATAAPTAQASNDSADATDASASAPWPPAGLAGLLLSSVTPTADPQADPALPAPTGAAAAAPLPTLPGNTPPVASAAAATPGGALPAAAVLAEGDAIADEFQAAVAAALQAATAGGDDDGGDPAAPVSPLLQGVHASTELRGAAAPSSVFAGEPTPTPSLDDGSFDKAMGARLGWLADQKIGHAHIRISPDDLGTVDVRLQLDGDKVHASFSSPHVDVRQALESSLPRLRELLGEQGFQLAHADVGQHDQSPQDGPANGPGRPGGTRGDGEPAHEAVVSAAQLIRQRGLLDTYA